MTLPSRTIILPVCLSLCLLAANVSGQGAGDALMRLLKSDRLPAERLPSVIEMVSKRGDAADLAYLFEQVTNENGWSEEIAVTALEGLSDAAANRKVKPEGDLTRLAVLFDEKRSPAVREQAIRLAGLWRVPELAESLQALVLSEKTSAETRGEALDALAAFGESGRKTIESLAGPDQPLSVSSHAIAALAKLDLSAAADRAAKAMAAAKPNDDVSPLLGAFLQRQGGPEALATALESAELPQEVAKTALRQMYSIGRSDGALSAALGKAAGIAMEDKAFTPEEIQQLTAAVLKEGDPERGELVFRRQDLSCLKCHAVSGAGGNIGPDLSAIGPSNPIDYLVTSILEPDAAVKEHYATQIIITSEGLVVTGIVADENENRLVLRTADGEERTIAKADVEEREKGGSLMPKGLVKFMTRQELLDLVRFLSELGKPGTPYALRSAPTVQRWRVLADPPAAFVESVPDEATFRESVPAIDAANWKPVYARVDGSLPLAELTSGGEQPVYLLAEFDVRTSGAVGLRFDSTEGLDLWVNGDHIDTLSRNFATEFPDGRQAVVLRVGPKARTENSLRVELFQPEGSAAVVDVVGGI